MTPYQLAYDYAQRTNRCIFLTGKAGTGKTTFLKRLRTECHKQMMVVAPTGVAAIHADGVTIHSLFQLPPQLFLPTPAARRQLFSEMQMRSQKQQLLQQLELLVIDEVSMVRSDLLDAIDAVLRHYRRRPNQPFGGVQLLLIGDLYQLSPVAHPEEWAMLKQYYEGPYFFQARVFSELRPVYIELDHVYRQSDSHFVEILNEVRCNRLSPPSLQLLNSRYQPEEAVLQGEPYPIILSTHNHKVDLINAREFARLTGRTSTFHAAIDGTFPESMYPMDAELQLREGARVMFTKNDSSSDKRYYNGKLGVVEKIEDKRVWVRCEEECIEVHEEIWHNIRYVCDEESETIEAVESGSFSQIPLRLAWAITIHKAQGLTFERVIIDAAEAFASGQVYVALSRCRTLEGIVLLSPIPERALTNAVEVQSFAQNQASLAETEEALQLSEKAYRIQLLTGLYDFHDALHYIDRLRQLLPSMESFRVDDALDYLTRFTTALADLQPVAERFQVQLRHLLNQPEVDEALLLQRLQAAAGYFSPKMITLLTLLKAHPLESNNKAERKRVMEQMKALFVHLHKQHFMMQEAAKDTSLEHWFMARRRYTAPEWEAEEKKKTKAPRSRKGKKAGTKKTVQARMAAQSLAVLQSFYRGHHTVDAVASDLQMSKKEAATYVADLLYHHVLHAEDFSQADLDYMDEVYNP